MIIVAILSGFALGVCVTLLVIARDLRKEELYQARKFEEGDQ